PSRHSLLTHSALYPSPSIRSFPLSPLSLSICLFFLPHSLSLSLSFSFSLSPSLSLSLFLSYLPLSLSLSLSRSLSLSFSLICPSLSPSLPFVRAALFLSCGVRVEGRVLGHSESCFLCVCVWLCVCVCVCACVCVCVCVCVCGVRESRTL